MTPYYFIYRNGTWRTTEGLPCDVNVSAHSISEAWDKLYETPAYKCGYHK